MGDCKKKKLLSGLTSLPQRSRTLSPEEKRNRTAGTGPQRIPVEM